MSMSVSEEPASEIVDLKELSSPLDRMSEDIMAIFSGIRDAEVDVKLFGSCPAEHRSFFSSIRRMINVRGVVRCHLFMMKELPIINSITVALPVHGREHFLGIQQR